MQNFHAIRITMERIDITRTDLSKSLNLQKNVYCIGRAFPLTELS